MRRFAPIFLAFALTTLPVLAQEADTWKNSEPGCDDTVFADTLTEVQRQQEESRRDANAVNDYYKKIKEGPRTAGDKLLSCVDIAWPDLPFAGVLPGIEEYIKNVGDKAVEQACNQMRDQVRRVDSVFQTPDLRVPNLNLPNMPNIQIPNLPTGKVAGPNPAAPAAGNAAPPDDGGIFGGLIDLIKPKPGQKP